MSGLGRGRFPGSTGGAMGCPLPPRTTGSWLPVLSWPCPPPPPSAPGQGCWYWVQVSSQGRLGAGCPDCPCPGSLPQQSSTFRLSANADRAGRRWGMARGSHTCCVEGRAGCAWVALAL